VRSLAAGPLEYPITDITGYPGAAVPPPRLRRSDDVAAAFLAGYAPATRRAYGADLRAWGSYLRAIGAEVGSTHRVHVDAFVRDAEASGAAPSTIARRLSALSGFYAYMVDEGLIDRSPVAHVRRPRLTDESPRFGVDRGEMRSFLKCAHESSPRDYALACLLALNGLRVSEALGADAADLGAARGHRTLGLTRKGGKRQTLAVAPRTVTAIETMLDGRTTGPLFVTASGRRMDRHAARKVVRRLALNAGVDRSVSPHSLRHGFVTLALDAGVPLRDVQDAAGHADPRTTRRYDRARHSLDRAATYAVASYLSE
jgi:integrase/recombinase XerD